MSQHDLCEYVIASVLSTTARAWGQTPVGPARADNMGPVVTANAYRFGKFSNALSWMCSKNFEVQCPALPDSP